jgi:hypothetical protein
MLNADSLVDPLTAADPSAGVIDVLEASEHIGTYGKTWLSEYQTKLAAGDTTKGEDRQFLKYLETYIKKAN